MRMEMTVAEFKELFKCLGSPDELFEKLRVDITRTRWPLFH